MRLARLVRALGAAVLLLAAAGPARAAADLTDHWFVPDEPGWGVSMSHQNGVVFLVLFHYSRTNVNAQGKAMPEWFVAPDMRAGFFAAKTSPVPIPTFQGTLYSTANASFASSFLPSNTRVTAVGDVMVIPSFDGTSATLAYRVGSTSVSKQMRRMSFSPLPLAGEYMVNMNYRIGNGGPDVSCVGAGEGAATESWRIQAAMGGGYQLVRPDGTEALEVEQAGRSAKGTVRARTAGLPGTWTLRVDHVGEGGLTGALFGSTDETTTFRLGDTTITQSKCTVTAYFTATRTESLNTLPQATPNFTDHWFNPAEPGWGISVAHQNGVVFLVLFHYSPTNVDAQGKAVPEWFVASEMRETYSEGSPAVRSFEGKLHSTANGSFTSAFNPANTQVSEVGDVSFVPGLDVGWIRYRIGSTTATKPLRRMNFAPVPLDGVYFVTMNYHLGAGLGGVAGPCAGQGDGVAVEPWRIEATATGGYQLVRPEGSVEVLEVDQAGRVAKGIVRSTIAGLPGTWTLRIDHVGDGGLSGTFLGVTDERISFQSGTQTLVTFKCIIRGVFTATRAGGVSF
jgi:hypothetical protein